MSYKTINVYKNRNYRNTFNDFKVGWVISSDNADTCVKYYIKYIDDKKEEATVIDLNSNKVFKNYNLYYFKFFERDIEAERIYKTKNLL